MVNFDEDGLIKYIQNIQLNENEILHYYLDRIINEIQVNPRYGLIFNLDGLLLCSDILLKEILYGTDGSAKYKKPDYVYSLSEMINQLEKRLGNTQDMDNIFLVDKQCHKKLQNILFSQKSYIKRVIKDRNSLQHGVISEVFFPGDSGINKHYFNILTFIEILIQTTSCKHIFKNNCHDPLKQKPNDILSIIEKIKIIKKFLKLGNIIGNTKIFEMKGPDFKIINIEYLFK